ncbi:MAG: DNA cytosine methyltransferase [Deltaproteobacteria bacterium]|jgi:DNA (cytosine-5)-methyltransferase 1|nr:DNA cytosine methyltransferase [Deltaproteobacteria bacterium]
MDGRSPSPRRRSRGFTASSLELFAGAGGLALGLHQAGFRPIALLERERNSCDTLRMNLNALGGGTVPPRVIQSDIREIDYSEFVGRVRFVSGGPPCQPFSLGGRHWGRDDDRDMFPEAVRAVRELRPDAFLFENVRGLLRKSFSEYFGYVLLQLSYPEVPARNGETWQDHRRRLESRRASRSRCDLEYDVCFRQVNAADYGVPQARHRVAIVGFRSGLGAGWSFPEPTCAREALAREKADGGAYWQEHGLLPPRTGHAPRPAGIPAGCAPRRWRTVRDALAGLPDPRFDAQAEFANHEFRDGARRYKGHSGSVLDEPSKALKAGVHGVPGGENSVSLDDGSLRYYTAREGARLQTFPDSYVFSGSWSESMRQIGNAVPVLLARAIGASVASVLGKAEELHG